MMGFLQHRSRRSGYDGWGVLFAGATAVAPWTVSTTRDECRQLMRMRPDVFAEGARIVKVRLEIQHQEGEWP